MANLKFYDDSSVSHLSFGVDGLYEISLANFDVSLNIFGTLNG